VEFRVTPAVTMPQVVKRPHVPNRKWDRVFFSTMILLLWATILFGFSKSYFMAGMVAAPLPNWLIHVHGAAFTLWMVLLLVQTTLITTGNVKIHRKLGMAGFFLAIAMAMLGVLAGVDQLRRGHSPEGLDPQTFFAIPMSDVLAFSLVVYFAYRFRNKPEFHKRIILMSTIAIADAGVGRWPIAYLQAHPPAQDLVILAFLLAMVAFDGVQLHRVSKATIWPSLGLIVIHLTRVPIGQTPVWHTFAQHMLKLAIV